MNIKKSNGVIQEFQPNKILKRIKDQSLDLKINPEEIFIKAVQGIVENMTTTELDNLLVSAAANKIVEHPDYSLFAARILITRQGKIIGVKPKVTDYLYDFFGIKKFFALYSLRNDNSEPLELPHMMYERVSNYFGKTQEEKNLFYYYLSNRKFTGATPILTNGGTKNKTFISCNLTTLIGDDTKSILNTISDISVSSRDGAGIGLHLHSLRSEKRIVSSFKGKAGGVVRFADIAQANMRFFKQGNRSGSAALYLGVWHLDILEFLQLRLPTGDEKLRTRDLFIAVCIPDLFMKKLLRGDNWYIFCPNDIVKAGLPPLHSFWGVEFENAYNKYVELGLGEKVSCKIIWDAIIKSQAEAGMPYVLYWDSMNRDNPQSNIGVLTGSNLCAEITEVTSPNYTAQCSLASINLAANKTLDEITNSTKVATLFLNRVIDKNKWSTKGAELAGLDQRALAIGVSGMANYLAMNKINYSDSASTQEEIIKTIYFAAFEESIIISIDEGIVYPSWKGSIYEQGFTRNGIEFPSTTIANSLLVGLMPTASTSSLVGVNESFEPFHSNLFVRKVDDGEFIIINRHLVNDLEELGLWNESMKEDLIYYEGSVQQLNIPLELKERYRTVWEISMKTYIDIAAARQKWVDQSQSLNLYYTDVSYEKISSGLIHGWEKGLKTGVYYTKTASKLVKPKRLGSTVKDKIQTSTTLPGGYEISCEGCTT